MYVCNSCKKAFRDNYALDRHKNRIKPCEFKVIEKPKNALGDESLENITLDIIAKIILNAHDKHKSNKDAYSYVCAGNIICSFHNYILEEPLNKNILYKSGNATIAKVLTDKGWVNNTIQNTVDMIVMKRAEQVLLLEDELEGNFFSSIEYSDIKRELESFAKCGIFHVPFPDISKKNVKIKKTEEQKHINNKETKHIYNTIRVSLLS
jgi:hypothetical protein